MNSFEYVNLLNLSLTFITFVFSFSLLVSFIIYRKKIQDRIVFFSANFINLLLLIYSIFSFYDFYKSGFFSNVVYELITFEHSFLAIVTIIPVLIIIVRGWNYIPKKAILFYILSNIINGFFLITNNYLASVVTIFFIVLFGSYVTIFAVIHVKRK